MSINIYSRPEWERDPTRLPDIEVFFAGGDDQPEAGNGELPKGWFWWSCTPGCRPESDAQGPYKTAAAAKRAAREGVED